MLKTRLGFGSPRYYGLATIANSTLTGNVATRDGGGVWSGAYSAGLATLVRSVVSGNTASTGAEVYRRGAVLPSQANVLGHAGLNDGQAFYRFTPGASDINATSTAAPMYALGAILDPFRDQIQAITVALTPPCSRGRSTFG